MDIGILISFVIVLSVFVLMVVVYILIKKNRSLKSINKRYYDNYSQIIDVDEAIDKKEKEFQINKERINKDIDALNETMNLLKEKYEKASILYQKLEHENNLLKDNLDISEYGIYEMHFDYETSDIFKNEIIEIREKQKELIKRDAAVLGGEHWTVNGSAAKGRAMVRKQKKLMLRAFNGECDNFITSVSWNNIRRMEERIDKSVNAINKMGESQGLEIASRYSSFKLVELRLTYEYRHKKQEEKEQQRAIKNQMREEEKARRDFEKAQKEAQKKEKFLEDALEKAKKSIAEANMAEQEIFKNKIAALENQLKEVEEKNQRAKSMAQQTKSGYVYVISNIGSFGENVFKIGMTRRLEPMDRVNELGDASVPFKFDVHAMIYSENAPELENQLHKTFEKNRLNYVNRRREFFKINIEDIKRTVLENNGDIEFILEPEAKEYRESILIRESKYNNYVEMPKDRFPEASEIF